MPREVIPCWGMCSVHELGKRQVIDQVTESLHGVPVSGDKLLKVVKPSSEVCRPRYFGHFSSQRNRGRREKARDSVLSDEELRGPRAALQVGGFYGGIVELLALTGQRERSGATSCVKSTLLVVSGNCQPRAQRKANHTPCI